MYLLIIIDEVVIEFFLLANIRLLLLTDKYVHSLQNSVGHLETRKFMIPNKKNYALPGPTKREAYSKKYQTVQIGYGHSYVSTYARHKQRRREKVENKSKCRD